jgi:hypothetical protein
MIPAKEFDGELWIRAADIHLLNKEKSRELQGLTDNEIDQGLLRSDYAFKTAEAWRDGVEWAIKQLKEKNNG